MQTSIRFLLMSFLFLILCAASPTQKWPTQFESKHYIVHARVPQEKVKQLSAFMEMVYDIYKLLLQVKKDPSSKFLMQIYKDREDFITVGRAPKAAGAYYSSNEKKLVGYYDEESMYTIFAHEGMHQFVDMVQPNFGKLSAKASWYTEGIADCIGSCTVKGKYRKRLYMCQLDTFIGRIRLPVIQQAIKANKHIPLKKFLRLTKKEYYANGALCYAQGWSLCHFLMTYPKKVEKTDQIPNGRYKKFIAYFNDALAQGMTLEKAYELAFDNGMRGNKMPSIETLEKQWKKYTLSLTLSKKKKK